ncbi:hypothetical protein OF364_02890 [Mycoplasma enhydrae]|uniref:hypothetical protein n=1 Tax=Mycoplasma enhydrae TaxID=2499220 RepID=UPI0021E91C26|nr:hypothetical protein [Mycoplasma enhydrae]MCV3753748.1 hypothetical protein [Mycoplasma enhydrae]
MKNSKKKTAAIVIGVIATAAIVSAATAGIIIYLNNKAVKDWKDPNPDKITDKEIEDLDKLDANKDLDYMKLRAFIEKLIKTLNAGSAKVVEPNLTLKELKDEIASLEKWIKVGDKTVLVIDKNIANIKNNNAKVEQLGNDKKVLNAALEKAKAALKQAKTKHEEKEKQKSDLKKEAEALIKEIDKKIEESKNAITKVEIENYINALEQLVVKGTTLESKLKLLSDEATAKLVNEAIKRANAAINSLKEKLNVLKDEAKEKEKLTEFSTNFKQKVDEFIARTTDLETIEKIEEALKEYVVLNKFGKENSKRAQELSLPAVKATIDAALDKLTDHHDKLELRKQAIERLTKKNKEIIEDLELKSTETKKDQSLTKQEQAINNLQNSITAADALELELTNNKLNILKNTLSSEILKAKETLKTAKEKLAADKLKVEEIKKELKETRDDLLIKTSDAGAQITVQKLEEALNALNEVITKADKLDAKVKDDVLKEDYLVEYNAFKKALEDAKKQQKKSIKDLETKKEEQNKQKKKEIEDQIKKLNDKKKAVEESLKSGDNAKIKKSQDDLKKEIDKAKDLHNKNKDDKSLKDENDALDKKIKEAQETLDKSKTAEEKLKELKDKIKSAEEKLKKAIDKADDALKTEDTNTLKEAKEELKKALDEGKKVEQEARDKKHVDLIEELKKKNKTADEKQKAIDKKIKEIEDKKYADQIISQINQKIQELKDALAEATTPKGKYDTSKTKLDLLNTVITSANKLSGDLKAEPKNNAPQIQAKLTELDQAIANTTTKYTELQKANEDLKTELDKKVSEFSTPANKAISDSDVVLVNKKIQELETAIAELKKFDKTSANVLTLIGTLTVSDYSEGKKSVETITEQVEEKLKLLTEALKNKIAEIKSKITSESNKIKDGMVGKEAQDTDTIAQIEKKNADLTKLKDAWDELVNNLKTNKDTNTEINKLIDEDANVKALKELIENNAKKIAEKKERIAKGKKEIEDKLNEVKETIKNAKENKVDSNYLSSKIFAHLTELNNLVIKTAKLQQEAQKEGYDVSDIEQMNNDIESLQDQLTEMHDLINSLSSIEVEVENKEKKYASKIAKNELTLKNVPAGYTIQTIDISPNDSEGEIVATLFAEGKYKIEFNAKKMTGLFQVRSHKIFFNPAHITNLMNEFTQHVVTAKKVDIITLKAYFDKSIPTLKNKWFPNDNHIAWPIKWFYPSQHSNDKIVDILEARIEFAEFSIVTTNDDINLVFKDFKFKTISGKTQNNYNFGEEFTTEKTLKIASLKNILKWWQLRNTARIISAFGDNYHEQNILNELYEKYLESFNNPFGDADFSKYIDDELKPRIAQIKETYNKADENGKKQYSAEIERRLEQTLKNINNWHYIENIFTEKIGITIYIKGVPVNI